MVAEATNKVASGLRNIVAGGGLENLTGGKAAEVALHTPFGLYFV